MPIKGLHIFEDQVKLLRSINETDFKKNKIGIKLSALIFSLLITGNIYFILLIG